MPKKSLWRTQKGQEFERVICKLLSMWALGSLPSRERKRRGADIFWRTPGSGARRTAAVKAGRLDLKDHAGDVMATHPLGRWFSERFFTECKNYKELEWERVINGGVSANVAKWWAHLCEEARGLEKLPMLIMKGTHTPRYLMLNEEGYRFFRRRVITGRSFGPFVIFNALTPEAGHLFLLPQLLLNVQYGPQAPKRKRARL